MKTTLAKMLSSAGMLVLCMTGSLAPAPASAAASSTGRVFFNSVEFSDLNENDGIKPGIAWIGKIDGSLDANAYYANHPPVSDHASVTMFASDAVNASIGYGTSATSSLTGGPVFFTEIQSSGYTGPGGLYDSMAYLNGLISLSPMSAATFSGRVSATATAGPSPADYAHGYAYALITALEQPPVDAVYCKVADDDFCSNGFSFTITNDTLAPIEIGYQLLTSVDGFSAPLPEPETYALMLAGLGLLGLTSRPRKQERTAG